jgi:hypothetical protein
MKLHLPKKNMKFFNNAFHYLLLLFVILVLLFGSILFFIPLRKPPFTAFETFSVYFDSYRMFNFCPLSLFYGFTFYLYQMLNTIPHMDM